MRITARYNTEVEGFGIVRRGQTIDLPADRISQRIKDNFTTDSGEAIKVSDAGIKVGPEPVEADGEQAAIDNAVRVIGREGLMRKLDDMGITYKPQHRTDYLAKLYLQAAGEIG